jgi:hypothetical protein
MKELGPIAARSRPCHVIPVEYVHGLAEVDQRQVGSNTPGRWMAPGVVVSMLAADGQPLSSPATTDSDILS